jgi:hypothetical protein
LVAIDRSSREMRGQVYVDAAKVEKSNQALK